MRSSLVRSLGATLSALTAATALAGCGAPPVPSPDQPAAVMPTTPPPAVRATAHAFETRGLPARSRAGDRVVLAIQDNDGGRGNRNLRLELRDRDDQVLEARSVMTVDEADQVFADPGSQPELDRRIVAVNAWLAELHRDVGLQPLRALVVDAPDGRPSQRTATGTDPTAGPGGQLVVDWHDDRLVIRRGVTVQLDQPTPSHWRAPDRRMCSTCDEICHNPAILDEVAIDADRRIAVVTISYLGTDTCWEPPDQHHVVAW